MAYGIKKKQAIEKVGEGAYSVNVHQLSKKSDDPLAYAYGFLQGKEGQPFPKEKGLAPEFVRGFKEGKAEREKK